MENKIIVNYESGKSTINKNIYGHFAEHLGRCIYDGMWVGEESGIRNIRGIRSDIVEKLKQISAPVIRWPGGCFADEYHWKDGVGNRKDRQPMVNSNWGGVVEDNQFGTHEFFDLCEQIGAEPYICGNVGSGTIHEMQEWIEYMNWSDSTPMSQMRQKNGRKAPFGIKYFGIGNENWGCGGKMTPEYYASVFKRYNTFVRNYGDYDVFRIACGPRNDDYHWTEVMMRDAGCCMDGLALHYYSRMFSSGDSKTEKRGSATQFAEDEWALILRKAHDTEELIRRHSAVMDRYDPDKRVALIVDEWGTWFEVEPETHPRFLYQQNTIRDALVASISLNIFNNHCDRVRMANIAQTVNVLQAMVLTDGAEMVLTPTYHVFDLYKGHQNALMLPVSTDVENYEFAGQSMEKITASASRSENGSILVTLNNVDPGAGADVSIALRGMKIKSVKGMVLTSDSMNDFNDFGKPARVEPKEFNSFRIENDQLKCDIPSMSVVSMQISQ